MSQSNFFQAISGLNLHGNLHLTIRPVAENKLVVLVMLRPDVINDKALNTIPPLKLTASAIEMDETFFATLEQPLKETSKLVDSVESYMAGLEKTKAASRMVKDQKNKSKVVSEDTDSEQDGSEQQQHTPPTLSKEAKKKAYEEAMKKVEALNAGMKYEEALAAMPSAADYPEKEKEIKNNLEDLNRKKRQLSMFLNES